MAFSIVCLRGRKRDNRLFVDLDLNVSGLDTTVTRMADCTPGGAVELWTIEGGMHSPRTQSGQQQSELPAKIVEWLFAHPKP